MLIFVCASLTGAGMTGCSSSSTAVLSDGTSSADSGTVQQAISSSSTAEPPDSLSRGALDEQIGLPGIDSTETQRTETLVGYYVWWMKGAWLDLDLDVYDRIVFFATQPGSDGLIQERNGWPHAWVSLLQKADSLEIPVVPALALMDADSIRTLFSSEQSIGNLVESSLLLIEESGGNGIHLDIELFETVDDSLRDRFFSYTDSLAERAAIDFPEARLSMFAPAFQYDGLYDLTRIHPGYAQIMVQGYDLHWQNGPKAGPVAPLNGWDGANWKEIVERYRAAGITEDRMIMTVPYYGFEWPVTSDMPGATTRGPARIITYAETDSLILPEFRISAESRIREFGADRDSVSNSPFYQFSDSTGHWQGWFEDQKALEFKYEFVRENRIRGIATFPMGYDRGILDSQLNAFFGRKRPLQN
jgi:hypothetical protein